MHVSVITPPTPVVTVVEAKKHLRVDHGDDDTYIDALISAATAWLDGPAGWLGRALGVQTLELQVNGFGCYFDRLRLPYPPLVDVLSVSYLDISDVEQTVAIDQYSSYAGEIFFKPTYIAPAVSTRPEPVTVRYRAGYGLADDSDPPNYANAIPAPIKVAILMLAAQWYETREPVAIGATVETLPFAVEALLSPYRVFA